MNENYYKPKHLILTLNIFCILYKDLFTHKCTYEVPDSSIYKVLVRYLIKVFVRYS